MKKITLIRHAKSSWADLSLGDHDRPLNGRGRRDGPFMAHLMASRGWRPDVLISSSAKRAFTTAGFFAKSLGLSSSDILVEKRIYEAGAPTIIHLVSTLDTAWDEVALFGHNPTFTTVANLFYDNNYLDNLPTCGIVEIVAPDVLHWKDFTPDTAQVVDIHYPKQYQ